MAKFFTFSTMDTRKLILFVFTVLEGVGVCLATDLTATDTTQTFSSTGYPTAYSNNQYESWTITSQDSNSKVRVDVTAASIEKATGSSSCDFDHISFYDGVNTTSATLLGKACESGGSFLSSGAQMLVVFDTDGSVTAEGFQASYYRTNCSSLPCSEGGGLTGGQIAGIVIGCILLVVIIVVVIILIICFCPKCSGVKETCLHRCGRKSKVRPVREDIEVHAMPPAKKKKQLPPLDTTKQSRKESLVIQETPKLPPIGTTVNPYHPPPFFTEGSGTWKNGPRKSLTEEDGKVPPPFNYTPNPR